MEGSQHQPPAAPPLICDLPSTDTSTDTSIDTSTDTMDSAANETSTAASEQPYQYHVYSEQFKAALSESRLPSLRIAEDGLDLNQLLLLNPDIALAEIEFLKKAYDSLSLVSTELNKKKRFLESVIPSSYRPPNSDDLARLEQDIEQEKADLAQLQELYEQRVKDIEGVLESIQQESERLQTMEGNAEHLASQSESLKHEHAMLLSEVSQMAKDTPQDLLQELAEQEIELESLRHQLQQQHYELDQINEQNQDIDKEVAELKRSKIHTLQTLHELDVMTEYRDKRINSTGKWFISMAAFLQEMNGVSHITYLSETRLRIAYAPFAPGESDIVLELILNPDGSRGSLLTLNAKLVGLDCPIEDIITYANLKLPNLSAMLPFVTRQAYNRAQKYYSLQSELSDLIQDQAEYRVAIEYHAEQREIEIMAESGLTYLLRVEPEYPSQFCLRLTEIMNGSDADLVHYKTKMRQMNVQTIKEFLHIID
ncbi:uncharacterized protein BJ171DRAFT_577726 [Polychytrium aggregatum]|uniref:uncharacterized protein n=1 Tax=Polychytrium aggregatum TaxID=110093 RepID=UPI0022FF206E|nr:uncharacterized protein BJ171DRAFT_577726 [Polychytrium aggregatum]KAI9208625.1 hypothetical protein BJ171DRAFT_577726 [Polychytrium aggregatum]